MPPQLALLLCLAAWAYFLRQDARYRPAHSAALWIPTLWILRCASRNLGYWFLGGDPEAAEGAGLYDPVFFLVALAAGWSVLWRRQVNWPALLRSNGWLFFFFAYMLFSVMWAPEGFVSLKRWVRTFGDLTMALVLVTQPDVMRGLSTLLRRCTCLLIPMSFVLVKYFPHLGRGNAKHWGPDAWIGVATHKNTLGQLCLVSLFWLALEITELRAATFETKTEKRYRWGTVLVCGALTLWLLNGGGHSRSSTSLLSALAGLAVFAGLGYSRSRPGLVKAWIVLGLGAWILLQPVCEVLWGKSLYELALASQGKDRTLTDRTMLWEDCIRIGMRRPLLGAGYRGFWTRPVWLEIKERNLNGPEEAHNGYIEVFLDLGLVGVALFVPVVASALFGAARTLRRDMSLGRLRLSFLTAIFLHNYAESGFPRPTHLIWFLFLVNAVNDEADAHHSLHSDV